MKLVTFSSSASSMTSGVTPGGSLSAPRPGFVAESPAQPHATAPIVDLPVALAALESRHGRASDPASIAARYGADMLGVIQNQRATLPAVEELLALYAAGQLAPEHDGTKLLHERAAVQLLAPIPRPLSLRDGYAFRQHVEAARRNRGVPMIPEFDQIPIFYYSNHLTVRGPGPIRVRPKHLEKLDYELEAAIVVGSTILDADVAAADDAIFGLMVMNDWSARALQMHEMTLNLGPAKGKDFATAIGPYLVPRSSLTRFCTITPRGSQWTLPMVARVNGTQVAQGNLADMSWTFAEILARASYGVTIHPGEVIGSGTVGTGCFLETNGSKIFDNWWIKAGDKVECEIDELGCLENTVELVP